ARIESSLLYRHWDSWRELRRSHIFTVNVETGAMVDITPGDADSPPLGLGGSQDYCFSPEGDEIAYVMNSDPVVALSTNNCIWVQKLKKGKPSGKPKLISDTKAADCDPCYSPDGKWLAYLGAKQPGYEADRMRVKIYDRKTGKTKALTEELDRSAHNPSWSPDSKSIYFLAPDMGWMSVYRVELEDGKKGAKPLAKQITKGVHNSGMATMPGGRLLVTRDSAASPADLHILEPGKGEKPHLAKGTGGRRFGEKTLQLTHHGDWMKKKLDIRDLEDFWYEGADKDMVHGFLLKPPKFNPKKKWRTILIIHGGPQSAFFDNFGYRWNPHLFASEGYVVLMLNPRGSTGYGQKFTDQISGDWGGRCYTDIMKGVAYCLETYEFIDKDKMAAAGASFGGFMVNWIAGHTDWFKALVSHDGIFNAETMAYMTEELWFDTWEHGGMPHENHKGYLKYSPHMHVENFKTPCLVVQGEQDFRCPVSEGIAMFTALQYMGVPSKLLYFPDEGHWVLKPANSQVWYRTILDFIEEHLGKP
ncbi:MAG: S9 family peptidase, partial [Candidatus Thermoplasmatota archaeon]|nr:S9 family peptidase [Candidatus Thermoplasmatota archaeon]